MSYACVKDLRGSEKGNYYFLLVVKNGGKNPRVAGWVKSSYAKLQRQSLRA